jgi:hypothetical protein
MLAGLIGSERLFVEIAHDIGIGKDREVSVEVLDAERSNVETLGAHGEDELHGVSPVDL